jgi:regulator of sigma E protease
MLSIITFIIVLSVLVIAHEFGHFVLARIFGIGVEEFAVGLPFTRPLWSIRLRDGLQVSIYPLLFGGFVRLLGEEGEPTATEVISVAHQVKGRETTGDLPFIHRPVWQRFVVIISGVVFNFLLAMVAFWLVTFVTGIPAETNQVTISAIAAGSPAEKADLRPGDIISGIEYQEPAPIGTKAIATGQAVTSTDQFIQLVNSFKGKPIDLEVVRRNQRFTVVVTPRNQHPADEGPLGVGITTTIFTFPPIPVRAWESLKIGVSETWYWTKMIVTGVGSLFWNLVRYGKIPADVGGPVLIAQVSGKVAQEGLIPTIDFLAILSINLGVLNVLPFPALDGGRLLFVVIEGIFGRRVAPRVEHWIHTAGMAILLTLMLFITMRDIGRILDEHGFWHNIHF